MCDASITPQMGMRSGRCHEPPGVIGTRHRHASVHQVGGKWRGLTLNDHNPFPFVLWTTKIAMHPPGRNGPFQRLFSLLHTKLNQFSCSQTSVRHHHKQTASAAQPTTTSIAPTPTGNQLLEKVHLGLVLHLPAAVVEAVHAKQEAHFLAGLRRRGCVRV